MKELSIPSQLVTMRLLFALLLLSGCPHPLPTPGPIPPAPDAGPADVFTKFTADCSLPIVVSQTAPAKTTVPACLDLDGGVSDCLVMMAKNFDPNTIVCLIVDSNVEWQRKKALGTATSFELHQSQVANAWIYEHQIGVRR